MPCRALLPCLETSETLAAQSRAPPLLPSETLVAQSWAPPTPALGLRASSRGETQPWCLHSLCPVTEQGGCETTGHWSLIKCYLGTEERLLSSRDRGEFQSGSVVRVSSTPGPPACLSWVHCGPQVPWFHRACSGGTGRRQEGKGGGQRALSRVPPGGGNCPALSHCGGAVLATRDSPLFSILGVSVAVVPTAWPGMLPSWGLGMVWALEGLARGGEAVSPWGCPQPWGETLSPGGLSHMPLMGTHEVQLPRFPRRGRLWRVGDSWRPHLVIRWPPPGMSSCTRQGLCELVGLRVDWGSLAHAEATGQGDRPWPQPGDQAPGPRVCALRPGCQQAQGWGQATLLSGAQGQSPASRQPPWSCGRCPGVGAAGPPSGSLPGAQAWHLAVIAPNCEPVRERGQDVRKRAHAPPSAPWVKGGTPEDAANET